MPDPRQQVLDILGLPDWKQDRLAQELSVAQSTIHRWKEGADPRGSARDAVDALWQRLFIEKMPVQRTVRLTGYVGAGQAIYRFDEDEAVDYVDAPPGMARETEAVEVRGESMLPLYDEGTVLYYSQQLAPDSMINKRCVVRLQDERVLVKQLRRGTERGLWTLTSLNAPDIEDVAVQWAAPIDWIKPR